MSKSNDKKPARPPTAQPDAKSASSVAAAFTPGKTKPADAGSPAAKTGGKSASGKKGR